ncbi:hypothetical protein [Cutibacterium sp.]|uniref:hypothetical protein n=1 Tax=Cutibacterium sp. TaxID=1912221 RepID=UPI0026DCEFDE|nr:hypothetical protein [Cutibacterium sp.]MDO4412416.1 hypothetical protein [Cutibacterium sp.]
MSHIPSTWCDPDAVGVTLPESDDVEADPQTVQIPSAESFEVLRRASEEELRAQERGESIDPLESGRAAISIALTPLCQLEGAIMLGVSLLEAAVKRVEQVNDEAVEVYLPDWLFDHEGLTAGEVPDLLVERVRHDLADPVVVSTMGEEAVEQLRSGLSAIMAAQRHDAAGFSRYVNADVAPEWIIDGCQEVCVALAAHAATIGWQRPEVDVSNVFASLDMADEPELVRTLLRQARR